ncbi:lysine--tRNA ligase [Patescibacteria group bacterium]|nr:lysine--tRNA ligase [Patescibacteria group bacterium]MBU2035833.1 lysine--tRNA ligase [Patescibacteria group bacterium]
MYWADEIAKKIISSGKYMPFWVDDMKTPSGFAHIGSLRGPLIHSVIYRALKDVGANVKFTFVFNDFDTADDLPSEFKEKLSNYFGYPLNRIPSPDKNFKSLADYFSNDLRKVMEELGVEAQYLSSWKMYKDGKFDEVIKIALDNGEKIQDIYKKISGSNKKVLGWLPFQVVCEKCGKLGTTRVFDWDGKEVSYKCEPNLVKWAKGCGHEGKISPFGGRGKLPWKVDWSAHWKVIGITIEGAGKDHASKGGSYDIAMELCDKVFNFPKPFKLPYEFILIGGKKMSSSKGVGLKAHDITKILPPKLARFLFTRTKYKEQVNFDPLGSMAIPNLFDEYDKSWKEYINSGNENLSRSFELAQIKTVPEKKDLFIPRFRDIANYLQQPNVKLIDKFEEIKGSKLTKEESEVLKEREKYARVWLKEYAPDDFQVAMLENLPKEVKDLSIKQKEFLGKLVGLIEKTDSAEELQSKLFELTKEINIPSLEAFSSIYLSFIGKERGPRAAWFLLSLSKDKVIKRLQEASK